VRQEGEAANATPQKVEFISQSKTYMSYIEQFETELVEKLNGGEHTEDIVRWVSEKILESYRNGITAGRKGETVKRNGQSRRPSFIPEAQ
jgi:hypothetical protein